MLFGMSITKPNSMFTSFYRLYTNLVTGILVFGKLSGAICHRGVLKWNSPGGFQCRLLSLDVLYTTLVTAYFFLLTVDLLIQAAVSAVNPNSTIVDTFENFSGPVYCFCVFLSLLYFLATSSRLTSVLKDWDSVTSYLMNHFNNSKQKSMTCMLTRELVAPIALLSIGIVENILFDVNHFRNLEEDLAGKTLLEKYFDKNMISFADNFPYHPMFGVLLILLEKSGVISWNYGDAVVIVFTSICTKQLCLFGDFLKEDIGRGKKAKDENQDFKYIGKKVDWENIRVSFIILSDSLQKVANYLAPLTLLCYIFNTYEMIVDLYLLLGVNLSIHRKLRAYVELLQIALRMSLVTYHVSEMHQSFRDIAQIFPECPNHLYNLSVQRLETLLNTRPFGVYLLGTVLITRTFFISIISFVFTTEIVLLQTMSVTTTASSSRYN